MTLFLIFSSAVILIFISLLHVYWAFGGRWGTSATFPVKEDGASTEIVPPTLLTLIVAFFILFFSIILLAQSGYLPFYHADTLTKWGSVLIASIFTLRAIGDFNYVGIFKRFKGTHFSKYDTWMYIPLFLYLAISFVVAVIV
ncbi:MULTISPECIES: DUF3995 domain-containing protein [Bacillus]|uniref:DUF3995 domain-containing protein n=2 Tax=Bacillus TaxID=1386 RepID=A0A0M4FSZ6_9BACI|nr:MULTISPECIES: DUF3995 domain-containing protein [Bacillus]ALC81205.1 hypothetical protein AM592_06045 [Bacillus gobiensis]MBP1080189.1 hypothetical protein [Bacillus capparidis]MED1094062.1 DUF3995 domain-containing protein [Bacillus capparidis]